MYELTILTPSYNRADLLPRVYQSLTKQTNFDFQWLVVDDGSTDNTSDVMKDLQKKEKRFKITYVYKINGGKHTALNYSHSYIEGKYVMVLDSDDFIKDNGVETVISACLKIKNPSDIGWLAFLRGDSETTTPDPSYKRDWGFINYIDYLNEGRKGEACDVYLTEVFKKYPYPEIPGETFVSESYLNIQAAIYGYYNMITINEIVQITKYLPGGLTDQGRKLQLMSPIGNAELWRHVQQRPFSFKIQTKATWLYTTYSLFGGKKIVEIVANSINKWKTSINLPFSYAIYLIWRKKYF